MLLFLGGFLTFYLLGAAWCAWLGLRADWPVSRAEWGWALCAIALWPITFVGMWR